MSSLKLITFDVMNTLMKPQKSIGAHYSLLGRQHGFRVKRPALDASFRKMFRSFWEKYPNFGLDQGMKSVDWWREVVRATFFDAGLQIHETDFVRQQRFDYFVNQLYRSYLDPETWKVDYGFLETVKVLHKRGILGVISNFDERLHLILSSLDVAPYLDFIITSREAGFPKPDPRIFQLALRKCGIREPLEALHIGDDYYLDYTAARDAGWNALWYCSDPEKLKSHPVEPSDVISDLGQLHLHPLLQSFAASKRRA